MIYRVVLAFGLLLLMGCTQNTGSNLEPGDRPLRPVYVIKASDGARIQYSILDGINSLRRAAGLQTLIFNAKPQRTLKFELGALLPPSYRIHACQFFW